MLKNGYKWKLTDALFILLVIFIVTNLFSWLLGDIISSLVSVQGILISTLLQTLAVIFAIFYLLAFRGAKFSDIGFRRGIKTFRLGFFGGLLILFIVIASGFVMEFILPFTSELQPIAQILLDTEGLGNFLFLLFIGAVLAPLGEELYFRGVVYPVFKNRFGIKAGMIVSGCFFALLHFDVLRFIPLTLGGIGLAYLYERSGSILTPMIAHGIWNGLMMLLLHFTARWI